VLLDVLGADRRFGPASRDALRRAYDAGALVACDVVWAEVRAHYASDDSFGEALDIIGVSYDGVVSEAARFAGKRWRLHLSKPGTGRRRLVADFLIGRMP